MAGQLAQSIVRRVAELLQAPVAEVDVLGLVPARGGPTAAAAFPTAMVDRTAGDYLRVPFPFAPLRGDVLVARLTDWARPSGS